MGAIWDEELEFQLTVPELALLTVEVHAREGRLLGTDMFVCGELRQGIRYVPLYDHKGERLVMLSYTSNVVFQFVYKLELLSSSIVVLQKSCSREVFLLHKTYKI